MAALAVKSGGVSDLRRRLDALRKRASNARAELKRTQSPIVTYGCGVAAGTGGALAGGAHYFLGDSWYYYAATAAAGIGLLVLGAHGVDGAAGAGIAASGGGILAKVAGDAVEVGLDRALEGSAVGDAAGGDS